MHTARDTLTRTVSSHASPTSSLEKHDAFECDNAKWVLGLRASPAPQGFVPWLQSPPTKTRQPNPIENIPQCAIPPIGTAGNARTEMGTTVLRNIRHVILVECDQAIDRHGLPRPIVNC